MARIAKINPETAPQAVRDEIIKHIADGHKITGVKLTMLHHLPSFRTLEVGSYELDDDLQRLIGKLDGDLFEYAVSVQNECLVCTTYFARLLREEHGLDPNTFTFTDRQKLLMGYGQAIVKDPRHVPDELFDRLRAEFSEEQIVAITTMGVMMVAMNLYTEVLELEPE